MVLVEMRRRIAEGEALAIRHAARLSQAEVAEHCGVNQQTISRWEHGERVPRGPKGVRYAELILELSGDRRHVA